MRSAATLMGLVVVGAHVAGFAWLAEHSRGRELVVPAPPRTAPHGDGGPGLVHRRWSESYRGGFTRSVGATQLVGPFQDPAQPACSGRVVIGQRMLDDSTGSASTIAGVMRQQLDAQLRGLSVFPVGDYRRVAKLSLRWAGPDTRPASRGLLGAQGAPDGYVRVEATIAFTRVNVPITLALIPQRSARELSFRARAVASLDFDNRVIQWVSDKVGADELATRVTREQLDDVLVTAFAPPPPFELGDGQTLQFTYCDAPVEIVEGSHGALPFAVAIGRVDGAPDVLPPRHARSARVAPRPDTLLALDLDLDALNAMLHELWRTGWLDRRLAEVGLDRRFNSDPIVTEYLSVRLSPLRLALPPVLTPAATGSLRLAADARVAIADGARTPVVGRAYGALDFRFAAPPAGHAAASLPLAVELGALELSCERDPATLVPCFGDLVAALRDRGHEFHGALTDAFRQLLTDIFVARRLGAEGLPADLEIRSVVPSLIEDVTLHLELSGGLVAPRP